MQPLLEVMSIFALMQQVWPNSVPAFISVHICMFFSTANEDREKLHFVAALSFESPEFTVIGKRAPGRTVISAFGLNALLPLLLHLLRGGVVDVGFALSEQLFSKPQYDGKVVTGVGELVWMDLEHGDIFQDHLRRSRGRR